MTRINKLTASPKGDFSAKSLRLRTNSYNQIQLQLNSDEEPTAITYLIDQFPQIIKTLSNGIEKDDTENLSYTITIPDTDDIKQGVYNHFVTIENSTGEFKLSLDKGRARVEV